MKLKGILCLLAALFLHGCMSKSETFKIKDSNATLYKIEYFNHLNEEYIRANDVPNFTISDKEELYVALNEIIYADNPEPWKGARWNKIKLYFQDTLIVLNTNDKKIGDSASGTFYDLPSDNFISRNLKKK